MTSGRVVGSRVGQHGGRTTAGGDVPWWVWTLLGWGVLALVLGLVLGSVIHTAERRELGRDREPEEDEQRPRAS